MIGTATGLLFALLLVMVPVAAFALHDPTPSSLFTSCNFTGNVAVRRAHASVPGAVDVLYRGEFGHLDLRGHLPMPPDAHYPVASNTKVYIAIALYQLQEQQRVDLARPIQEYLTAADMAAFGVPGETNYCPTVQGNHDTRCRNITFEQLLDMTAGIADQGLQFLPFPGSLGAVFGRYVTKPLVHEPGASFYYSNPSFMLAAYFVEKFSGLRLQVYLKRNIFDIVGLEHTYFDVFNGKMGFARIRQESHKDTETTPQSQRYDPSMAGIA